MVSSWYKDYYYNIVDIKETVQKTYDKLQYDSQKKFGTTTPCRSKVYDIVIIEIQLNCSHSQHEQSIYTCHIIYNQMLHKGNLQNTVLQRTQGYVVQ